MTWTSKTAIASPVLRVRWRARAAHFLIRSVTARSLLFAPLPMPYHNDLYLTVINLFCLYGEGSNLPGSSY